MKEVQKVGDRRPQPLDLEAVDGLDAGDDLGLGRTARTVIQQPAEGTLHSRGPFSESRSCASRHDTGDEIAHPAKATYSAARTPPRNASITLIMGTLAAVLGLMAYLDLH